MKYGALASIVLLSACGGRVILSDSPPDGAVKAWPYAAECAGAAVPPPTITCTGLYADVPTKELADGVRPYAPATPLWSDGAEKQRWIWLPPGTKIDASDPNEWKFPIGTKVWKEFSRGGKRVETRLFQKVQDRIWERATYAWNADDSAAPKSTGGDIPLGSGDTYHIPTGDECDQCHKGRTDRILGFEQVSLGTAGATGITLADLVTAGLITPVPKQTALTIGDDGTGEAAPALAWLHVNCGVSCHNDNANSTGFGATMRLRLDPALLDGRSSAGFDSLRTTVGSRVTTPAWSGVRIVPGDPSGSLLVQLISNRGTSNPVNNQMPPIASRLVDTMDVAKVVAWIGKMPGGPETDAGIGVVDTGVTMTVDAGVEVPEPAVDASVDVTTPVEAAIPDAANDVDTDAGSDDDGGATDDGATDDGATDDGETDGGTTDDGATDGGATDDGGGNDEPDAGFDPGSSTGGE